ncbi:unnamed protein product [Peniophora sp. CBMAI 1063]|nr:unnamed protein product [Peniophora sp. CBMAI 1063]
MVLLFALANPFELAILSHLFLACAVVPASRALDVPSTWVNTTSDLSRDVREAIAYGAASTLDNQIQVQNTALEQVQFRSSYYSGLALQDYHSGKTTWMSRLTQNLPTYYLQNGVYGNIHGWSGDADYWALAFYYAYRAYKQETLLNTTIDIYNKTYMANFITPGIAAGWASTGVNGSFPAPPCSPVTFAGAVSAGNDSDKLDVVAESVGSFLMLSAYLFEATNQSFYREAAQLSVDFMIRHMWNGTLVVDTLHLTDCSVDVDPVTLDQAGYIEGLSVWANVTQNATLVAILRDVVSNVTTSSRWHSNGGIINESNRNDESLFHLNLKGVFVRALLEARARNPGTDLDRYIEAYVLNQFNSILLNSRGLGPDDDDFYGSLWTDQHALSFQALGSINALDVLNGVINMTVSSNGSSGLQGPTATNAASASASGSASISRHNPTHIGAIAGATVGGVVITVLSASFLLRRRYQRATRTMASGTKTYTADNPISDTSIGVDPFIDPHPTRQFPSKWQRFYAPNEGEAGASFMGAPAPATTDGGPYRVEEPEMRPMRVEDRAGQDRLGVDILRLRNFLHGYRQGELPPAYVP